MQHEKNRELVLLKFGNPDSYDLQKAAINLRKETERVLSRKNWFANLPPQKKTILAKYAQLRMGQKFVEQNLEQGLDSYSNLPTDSNSQSGFNLLSKDVGNLGWFHLHLLVFPCCLSVLY